MNCPVCGVNAVTWNLKTRKSMCWECGFTEELAINA